MISVALDERHVMSVLQSISLDSEVALGVQEFQMIADYLAEHPLKKPITFLYIHHDLKVTRTNGLPSDEDVEFGTLR